MRCYAEHARTIRATWERLERRLQAYPPALRGLSVEFLASLPPPHRSYFSSADAPPLLYLPLWLGACLPRRRVLEVLEGTALLYFSLRIEDDVIDEPGARGHARWLLLGNACLWDGLALLGFGAWPRGTSRATRRAWLAFSDATEAERRQVRADPPRRYGTAAFRAHARRHAAAELPLHVVLGEMGRSRSGRWASELIEALGRAYAYTNDLRGFQRDVAGGHVTRLVSLVRSTVPSRAWREPSTMMRALVSGSLVMKQLAEARRHHLEALAAARRLRMRGFDGFTAERLARLDETATAAGLAALAFRAARHP